MPIALRFRFAVHVAGLLLAIVVPVAGQSQPVPRVRELGIWRNHHPGSPFQGYEPWTPRDVALLLQRFPDAYLLVGSRQGYPIGNLAFADEGKLIGQLRQEVAALGLPFEHRVCLAIRPDVIHPFSPNVSSCAPSRGGGGCDFEGSMDGSFGEAENVVKVSGLVSEGTETGLTDAQADWYPGHWKHRLLVLRPGRASEERRRIVANDAQSIEVDRPWSIPPRRADRYEIRGSFDLRWIQRVSRERHEEMVRRLWVEKRDVCMDMPNHQCSPPAEPLDPFDPRNKRSWPAAYDEKLIRSLATPTQVPSLYGFVHYGRSEHGVVDDPYFQFVAVVMRVEDPAYRAWLNRYLLYKLRDHGFAPGDSPCIVLGYKPGLHIYYDAEANGPSGERCEVPGSNTWLGPVWPCVPGARVGGRFAPTPWGPGEYEEAVAAFALEMIQTLESAGYRTPRIVTSERPKYRRKIWSALPATIRNHPAVAGEREGPMDPPLSLVRREGGAPPASPPATGGPATPESPGAPQSPAPALPDSEPTDPQPSASASPGASSGSLGTGARRSQSPSDRRSSSISRGRSRDVVSGDGGGGTVEPPRRR